MNGWTVKIYNDFDVHLENLWRNLESECQNYVFQSYDWIYNWQQIVGNYKGIKPVIITVSHNGKVVALFPMALRIFFGTRILEFIGGDQSDYNAPLIIDKYVTNEKLREIWSNVKIALPSHHIKIFLRVPNIIANKENFLCTIWKAKKDGFSYGMTIPNTTEENNRNISKKIIADSKRQTKRLNQKGKLLFVNAKTNDYELLVDEMIKQKRERYQATGVRDILADPFVRNFYKKIKPKNTSDLEIHLSALKLDESIIATHWGCLYKKRFYFLMPTYHKNWNKFSPGRLLLENLINWAIANNLKVFDFTIGSENYKKNYCDQEQKIYKYIKLNSSLGLPYFIIHSFINFIKNNHFSRKVVTSLISKYRKLGVHH